MRRQGFGGGRVAVCHGAQAYRTRFGRPAPGRDETDRPPLAARTGWAKPANVKVGTDALDEDPIADRIADAQVHDLLVLGRVVPVPRVGEARKLDRDHRAGPRAFDDLRLTQCQTLRPVRLRGALDLLQVAQRLRILSNLQSCPAGVRDASPCPSRIQDHAEVDFPESAMTSISRATTQAQSAASRAARGKALLLPQQVITSPETRIGYRIDSLLGQGGFGQAYLATRMARSAAVPKVVAIKASEHIDGWLREAYFGQLLEGHSRAIRVFDTFPAGARRRRVLYCLALEYAKHGDLRSLSPPHREGLGREDRAARDRGDPRGPREAPSRPAAPPGPDPDERLRLRRLCLKLGDFGIVQPAERPARRRRATR